MKINNFGFANFIIIFIIFFVLGVGFFGYYTINSSKSLNQVIETKEECARPEMFSKNPATKLEKISPTELKLFEPDPTIQPSERNKSLYLRYNYLDVLKFATLQDENVLHLKPTKNKDNMIIASKMIDGEPGYYVISHYSLSKSDCVTPSIDYTRGEEFMIKTLSLNNLRIYQVPSGIGRYGDMPDTTYFIELPDEASKKINAKFIKLESWYYDLNKLETVLRSFELNL